MSLSNSDFPHLLPTFQGSVNTIVIDAEHPARLDFTSANSADEGKTWKMIGDNADADSYLLSGAPTGCGSAATAARYRGTAAAFASEAMGILGIMMIPLSLIAIRNRIRRRKGGRVYR